jgi:hypothetical protein
MKKLEGKIAFKNVKLSLLYSMNGLQGGLYPMLLRKSDYSRSTTKLYTILYYII